MKVDFHKLDRAFNPSVVVVVGDSKANNFEWIRGQKDFKGKLYSVHVNPDTAKEIEALGIQNFTSILDVPENIDLAIVAVSRKAAPAVLDECIRKKVAAAHFFSAGFAESDEEEGINLERALKERAEKANFHLIGPNCMGLYNPASGIKQMQDQYTDLLGSVGFISQSGSIAIAASFEMRFLGLGMSKSVSFGNGIVLDSPDFIEYFGNDPEIKVIAMYLEGVKDGPRFLSALKRVTAKKPVIIWKGGRTEEGGRAIASHTGSLAATKVIWDAAVRQSGALQVNSLEELIDTTKALLFIPYVKGNRVAIAGGPGGQSVIATDVFAETGLNVPAFTEDSNKNLASFFEMVGGSYKNPIDSAGPTRRDMNRVMKIVGQDANIDNIIYIVSFRPGRSIPPEILENVMATLLMIKKESSKPLIGIVFFYSKDSENQSREVILKLQEAGIPGFPSVQRGALALRNALNYYEYLRKRREPE